MRKTKEFYIEKYEKAIELWKKGLSIKNIASRLDVSYSAVYAWIKGRKPVDSKIIKFIKFLKANGPTPLAEIKKKFPKHSEIYTTAVHRGFKILRYKLPRKFGDYSIWYLLPQQEANLKEEVEKFLKTFDKIKNRIADEFFDRMSH